jgi:hypothetical protein
MQSSEGLDDATEDVSATKYDDSRENIGTRYDDSNANIPLPMQQSIEDRRFESDLARDSPPGTYERSSEPHQPISPNKRQSTY